MGDFGNANRGSYSAPNHGHADGGYVGSEYNVNDRSSKRLRLDGISYAGESDAYSSNFPWNDNERRLKLVRDHGGPNAYPGHNRDTRGYVQENPGFDGNFDGREPGNLANLGVRNTPDKGYGVNYQKQELEYHSGYGSHHGIKRTASDVEHGFMANKFQNHEHEQSLYGNAAKPPDNQLHGYHHSNYGSSHVSKENCHGSKFQPMPENAAIHYEQRSNMPTSSHHNEIRSNMPISTHQSAMQTPFPDTIQQPGQMGYGYHSPSHFNDIRQPLESRPHPIEGYQCPFGNQSVPMRSHYGPFHMDSQGRHGNSVGSMDHWQPSQGLDARPPLPASPPPPPPPPLPMEPSGHWSVERRPPSPPRVSSSLFPIPVSSAVAVQSSYAPVTESNTRAHPRLPLPPRGMFHGDSQATLASSGHHLAEGRSFVSKDRLPEKSQIIDASQLFNPPHRATRPDHFVIILRGLPGSGKSYLAKMLRDLEVEHGGNAPRIHSMDDYFMTEVEKAEENDASKSSMRGKKLTMKKVLEYCYEPEMEEAYRSSMLKAFKKTLEEGVFTFVIVDDRNLRVADFAQFWATAKRSGYEVYILEAPYKDPAGCTARNVHGFTQDDVEKMAVQWEEAPSLYLKLDVKSLFHGDDLKEGNIQEVDMDTEDGGFDGNVSRLEEREHEDVAASSGGDLRRDDLPKDESSLDAEGVTQIEVKDLGRSKWLDDLDEEDNKGTESLKGKSNVLSGLLRTYGKEGKSVRWGDQGGHTGFSIGAVKKANMVSLVIGPGAGYNLKTNPLPEEDARAAAQSGEMKRHSVFKERLRAEQESFRAVFDNRRRQRIGGLDAEEE